MHVGFGSCSITRSLLCNTTLGLSSMRAREKNVGIPKTSAEVSEGSRTKHVLCCILL